MLANEINNLVVKLSLDNIDFRQGISNSGRAVRTLQNELKSISTGMGGFANASDQARAKVDTLNRLIEAQKEKVKNLRDAYDQNKAKLGENDAATQRYAAQVNKAVADLNRFENELKQVNKQAGQKEIDKLSTTMKALQAEFQSISTGMGNFANSAEQTRAKIDVLNRMVDTQRQKVQQLSDAYHRSKQSEGENSQATQQYAEQLHRATAELNRFENELQQANRELDEQSNRLINAGHRMETLGNNLQNAGMQIGVVFGGMAYAMGRGLKSAVEESMNFEQQMANVKAVSGATAQEMDTLSKLAVKYGEDTKYSSVEAGKGIEELIKAGVSLTDIINGGLEGALNLASAGELELGEAAEIASTALNAFKKDGLSVTDAANLLAGAANASATDVHELKYGLSASAAVAAGAGMTFKDTATALAVFAQNGLKGSDAGTSLKTMLMRLNPTTKEAYNKMRDLGLITYNAQAGYDFLVKNGITPASRSIGDIETALESYVTKTEGATKWNDKCDTTFRELATSSAFLSSKFYDQTGHIESLESISGILHESMKGLTEQQRSMALETLFGSDAVRGATILFNEGASGVKNMYTEMSKVTALETVETKMNTVKGRIEQLSGAFDTMKKTIGDALMPAVGVLVSGLQYLVDGFNNLSPGMQKFISISAGVVFGLTAIVAVGATILAGIGGVVAGMGALATSIGVAGGAAGLLSAAFAALTGPIGLTILGLGAAAVAIGYFVNESQKAQEDIDKFGMRVSDGTRKAAGAYIDLKETAINNMMDLKLKTGEEANKAADETIKAFQRMTNEVIKELEGKKTDFNKMFSQLMGTVPESAKGTLEQVKNNVIEAINKEIEVATEAEKILEEGIKRYQGDTLKMPKDFAQKFDQALQVADKNVQQFYTKSKEIASISKEIESGGMLSLDAGKKRFESIIKVYDDGIKSLEKQTKGWRENVEKAFKLGEIKPEERKATLDAIALYESKHVSDLQTIRNDGFKVLQEHLKKSDQEALASQAKRIEAEGKGWKERFKAAYGFVEDSADLEKRYRDGQEKAEKEHQDKLLAYEYQYGKSKIQSLGDYLSELQKGTESSKLLAESMARDIDGKLKIDLGDAGQFTIDTFLQKLQKGELDSNAIATANANKLKEVYKVDLSQSGIDSMKKWIDGIKTKDTAEVRTFLGDKLKGDTTIDLGVYGKMTADSWISGLQNGTLSFDTVFKYFQDQAKNGMKVDATEEGKGNIQTLINGMQIGALNVQQVAKSIGLNIKNDTKVDLGESGTFTVATLVQGMQNGSINAEIAAKAIAKLIENGAKLDLTQVGSDISQTQANGISNNTAPETAATDKKNSVEQILGSTTDGGGGPKSMLDMYAGMLNNQGLVTGQANNIQSGVQSILGSTTDGNGGNNSTSIMAGNIANSKGNVDAQANNIKNSSQQILGSATDGGGGAKQGTEFSTGLGNQSGKAKSAGTFVANEGKSGLENVKTKSVGQSFAEGFADGMKSGGSIVNKVASSLALGAFEALKATLNVNSPSRLVRDGAGKPFGEGFEVGISQSTRNVEKASRNLAFSAYNTLKTNARLTTPIGESISEGIASGMVNGIGYIKQAASTVANSAFNDMTFTDVNMIPKWKNVIPENNNGISYKPVDTQRRQLDLQASEIRIEVPVMLDGREIARSSYKHISNYQNREEARMAGF